MHPCAARFGTLGEHLGHLSAAAAGISSASSRSVGRFHNTGACTPRSHHEFPQSDHPDDCPRQHWRPACAHRTFECLWQCATGDWRGAYRDARSRFSNCSGFRSGAVVLRPSHGLDSAGAIEISDAVDLDVSIASDLAVSIYIPDTAATDTMHAVGLHTTYISKEGDATGQAAIADGTTSQSFYFLTNVDVAAAPEAAALVTFGDSITDGAVSTPRYRS